MDEKWKDIKNYEGLYKVSDFGRVYSVRNKMHLKPTLDRKGYYRVSLSNNGYRKIGKVHRLVAEAFIKNPNGLPHVNHLNEIKTDNHHTNLEWCTPMTNNLHGDRLNRVAHSNRTRKHKQIGQFTLDGKLIATYDGFREVGDAGYSMGNVNSCCNKKPNFKTCKGYVWRYLEN